MKKLLAILILILTLQNPSQADDISDIEIEGMSIGDSLLKIMSKDEIKSDMDQMYKSKKFSTVIYFKTEVYDAVQFSFLTNDDNFIVKSIEAKLIFKYDIESCLKKQEEVTKSIKETIGSYTQYYPRDKEVRLSDPSGKSFMYAEAFTYNGNESLVQIYCTDWSKDFEKKDWHDELKVSIWSDSFSKFLETEAY